MKKTRLVYVCRECSHKASKWQGRCPECRAWNSFDESTLAIDSASMLRSASSPTVHFLQLTDIPEEVPLLRSSGVSELDRVLGGGILAGGVVLIGGEPGIGKSTLLLQLAYSFEGSVVYISGEESLRQVKWRSHRLQLNQTKASLKMTDARDLDVLLPELEKNRCDLIIVDSIQTLFSSSLDSAPGSLAQLKYCCQIFSQWAKEHEVSLFLIGHITKEGVLAGPKVIEHLVDTVLSFEDSSEDLRILRAQKNRFGSLDELGFFRMSPRGLHVVENFERYFLVHRHEELPQGVSIAAVYEGTRVLLVEIQALTIYAPSASRIYSDRIDSKRISRLCAVLEKHLNIRFHDQDVYINVAGGIRLGEVGLDLALLLALYSARTGCVLPKDLVFSGEVSLAGELRPVSQMELRVKVVKEMGFLALWGARSRLSGEDQHLFRGFERLKVLVDSLWTSSDSSSTHQERV